MSINIDTNIEKKAGYYRINKKYVRWLKYAIIIFITLDCFQRIYHHYNHSYPGSNLKYLIGQVLGNPHYKSDDKFYTQYIQKLHLSEDEWNEKLCSRFITYKEDIEIIKLEHKDEAHQSGQLCLKDCILGGIVGATHSHTHYNHWNSFRYMEIGYNQELVRQKRVFNMILDVAEKPCKYIGTGKDFIEYALKHHWDKDKEFLKIYYEFVNFKKKQLMDPGKTLEITRAIKNFECESKNKMRKYVLINIGDDNREYKYHIFVKRKD